MITKKQCCNPLAVVALVCLGLFATTTAMAADDGPYEITEDRIPCDNYDPNRQPLFGTTHLHTGLSFDASIRFVQNSEGNNPHGAYKFAKGEQSIQLPDPLGFQTREPLRNPMIDRPLDWGAVTDHSEHFGEMGICKDMYDDDSNARVSMECRMINGFYYQPGTVDSNLLARTLASNAFTQLTVASDGPMTKNTRTPMCENNSVDCRNAELAVWDEMQSAAHDEYDRTSDCSFTTFVAYENTSSPSGVNWHRNVIFRNDRVVQRPITAIDMAVRKNDSITTGGPNGVGEPPNYVGGIIPYGDPEVFPAPPGKFVNHPLPQRFWNKLEWDCTFMGNVTDGYDSRCDFITIPHNSNLGGGIGAIIPPLFLDPFNKIDAQRRAKFEPLVEIYQDKGSSECRWDPRYKRGVETRDEFCNFEILDDSTLAGASGVGGSGGGDDSTPEDFNPRAYVRNVWKAGLEIAEREGFDGANPFKMGVVAASDSHTGVMGFHPEDDSWPGHLGIDDAWPMSRPSTIQNSTGGHSVVWAEENSRDSIFAALRRKETYGTSGTRLTVRFFGGWKFKDNMCETNFVPKGYKKGVPMGGDLPPKPNWVQAPKFIVAAWMDDYINTPLEQIHIIKGWYDENGRKSKQKERVYRIAGDRGHPRNPAKGIDPDSGDPLTPGYDQLCAVWEDPDFDPDERAFYYARVIEKPVFRYSTVWCRNRLGLDPMNLRQCRADLKDYQDSDDLLLNLRAIKGAACCNNQRTDTYVQPVIQERAWTSPIWYTPDA